MKNVDKMSMRELRGELRETRGLLVRANCPDTACLMGTVTGKQIGPSEWRQHKCDWCADRSELIGEN